MVNFPALYAEAWTAPRQSMRRVLDLSLSERDRLIMVAITGVLFAIPVGLMLQTVPLPTGPDGEVVRMPSTLGIAPVVIGLIIAGYYLTALLVKGIGAIFGGTASFEMCKSVSAWSQFVVGLANIALTLITFLMPSALASIFSLIFTAAALYVSSAYIAEAHGFKSTGNVVGISVLMTLTLIALLSSSLPVAMMRPGP